MLAEASHLVLKLVASVVRKLWLRPITVYSYSSTYYLLYWYFTRYLLSHELICDRDRIRGDEKWLSGYCRDDMVTGTGWVVTTGGWMMTSKGEVTTPLGWVVVGTGWEVIAGWGWVVIDRDLEVAIEVVIGAVLTVRLREMAETIVADNLIDSTSGSLPRDVVAVAVMPDPLMALVGALEKSEAAWVRAVRELFLLGKLEQALMLLTACRYGSPCLLWNGWIRRYWRTLLARFANTHPNTHGERKQADETDEDRNAVSPFLQLCQGRPC